MFTYRITDDGQLNDMRDAVSAATGRCDTVEDVIIYALTEACRRHGMGRWHGTVQQLAPVHIAVTQDGAFRDGGPVITFDDIVKQPVTGNISSETELDGLTVDDLRSLAQQRGFDLGAGYIRKGVLIAMLTEDGDDNE